MESILETHAAELAELSEDVPMHVARLASGLQVVKAKLPSGMEYETTQLGLRELELFEKGRADLMEYAIIPDGAFAYEVLSSRTLFGVKHYVVGDDGVDHVVYLRPITGGRTKISEYTPKGYRTSHNPEAINKYEGRIKEDYEGGTYRTIQLRMLLAKGHAFDHVTPPATPYEEGIYALGASVNWGGWKVARAQLTQYVKRMEAGTFVPQLDGVHFLQFLGGMCQLGRGPAAVFVKIEAGDHTYQDKPIKELEALGTAFIDGKMCLDGWMKTVARYPQLIAAKQVGLKLVYKK